MFCMIFDKKCFTIYVLLTKAGLTKIVHLLSRNPGFASKVGRLWFFFILVKVSFVPRALPLFDISLVVRKKTLIRNYNIVIRLWLINATRGYDLTSEP